MESPEESHPLLQAESQHLETSWILLLLGHASGRSPGRTDQAWEGRWHCSVPCCLTCGTTPGQHRHAGPRSQHVLPTAELIAINSPSQTHRSSKSASVQHHCTHLGLLPLRASWGKGDDVAALLQNQVGWEDTGACVLRGACFVTSVQHSEAKFADLGDVSDDLSSGQRCTAGRRQGTIWRI